MLLITAIVLPLIAVLVLIVRRLNRRYVIAALCRRIHTVDGRRVEDVVAIAEGNSIFANSFDIISMNAEKLFYYARDCAEQYKRGYIQYILGNPVYNIIDAEDAELVLTDGTLIKKGIVYRFLEPCLKQGLLTSDAKKWHSRRKLLTPAFHFNILTQFAQIFKRESEKFVVILNSKLRPAEEHGTIISLGELIPRFTLNNICETALGVRLDDRLDGDEYRENLEQVEGTFVKRVVNPLLTPDLAYYIFGDGRKDVKYLRKLHEFSSGIIEKKRQLFNEELQHVDDSTADDDSKYVFGRIYTINTSDIKGRTIWTKLWDVFISKKRYAMLDTLLRAEQDGLIDHAGICEEVDTFMFEGFDTTSMNLIFALMNFALHPEVQQRCVEEIGNVIGDTDCDIAKLNELRYLECCIKETQRLYPSVPVILRECIQDTPLANNLLLPEGTQVVVHIFDIHRNPKYYENPNKFQPERFFAENAGKRHPFAFIPFSAGQRNCIGQKFAMLEMKMLLVYVLKNFELHPESDPDTFRFLAGILIRSRSDVKIRIVKRK